MKITEKTTEKTFEPITIEIVLESKEDVALFYAAFNVPELFKNDTTPKDFSGKLDSGVNASTFNTFYNIWERIKDR